MKRIGSGGGGSCGHESEVNVEKVLEKEKVEKDKGEVKEKMDMATNMEKKVYYQFIIVLYYYQFYFVSMFQSMNI